MAQSKIFIRILLNSLLGLALIFIWSRFVDLTEILKILQTVNPSIAFVVFFLLLTAGGIRSFRLWLILKKYQLVYKDLLMVTFLGQFLSFFIPIRAGEVTKGVYLATNLKLPITKSLVWVFADRFLDFWATFLLICLFLPFVSTSLPFQTQILFYILLVVISLIFILAILSQEKLKMIVGLMSYFLIVNRIKVMVVNFSHNIIEGFSVFKRKPQEVVIFLLLSVGAVVIDSIVWFSIFNSLGIKVGLDLSVLGNSLSALTFLIPAAPGYVGSAEAAMLAVFSGALKMDPNIVSAATVVFHVLTLIILLLLGVSSLYILKFDLSSVWKRIRGQE